MYDSLKPYTKSMKRTFLFLFITHLVGKIMMLYFPLATEMLVDHIIITQKLNLIILWGVISIFIAILVYGFNFYFIEYLGDKCCTILANDIRKKLISKILNMSSGAFNKLDKGMVFNTAISETNIAAVAFFNNKILLSTTIIQTAIYIIVLGVVNLQIAIITIMIIPIFIIFSKLNQQDFNKSIEKERNDIDNVVKCFNNIVDNKKAITMIKKENFFLNRFSVILDKWGGTRIRYNFFYTFLKILPRLLDQSTLILLYCIGAVMVMYNKISFGELIMMSQIIVFLFQEITSIVSVRIDLKNAKPLFNRINYILKFESSEENDYKYGNQLELSDTEVYVEDNKLFYVDNFVIKTPNLYLINAENGCGKSYFMNCIMGFSSGIRSGKNQNIVPTTENIGMMTKTDLFIEDKVINNIFIDEDPDDSFMKEMNEIFNIDFLNKIITLSPINLSLGQQQKISLCRFFWFNRNKEYWILDEPLVNLDMECITNVIKYIKNQSMEKKIIVISHDEYFENISNERYVIKNKLLMKY